jgi:DNA topoisomerase-3
MEGAGKLVDDEELRDAMKEKGLGTPATRASIIETLISAHYLNPARKGTSAYRKGDQTITLLKSAVPELTSPELTGEWEFRLARDRTSEAHARRVHARHPRSDEGYRWQSQAFSS